jgi:uncharacterized protein (TIGR00251 family)
MTDSKVTTKIFVHAYPNATKNEITGLINGVLSIKISAPPVKGKANKELISFLSQRLALGKGRIDIIKGHTTRNKIIAIDGMSQETALKLLQPDKDT